MLNTGNLLGSLAAPSSATGLVAPKNPALSAQTTTPAAQNYNATYPGSGVSTGQTISPNLSGLIPLTPPNPNADAINAAHAATVKALNAPQTQSTASAPLGSSANPQVASSATGLGQVQAPLLPSINSSSSSPYTYDANGNLVSNPNAAPGTPGSSIAPQIAPATSQTTAAATLGTNPTPASVGGLLGNLALNGSPQVAANNQALQNYQGQVSNALLTVGNTPGPLGNQIGREANINSAAALQEQALQTGIANALQEQDLQQTGLNDAGGLVNPGNQFIQGSPGGILFNNQGQAINSTPSNQPIGQTVQVSPTPGVAGGTAGEVQSYTIKSGDTLNAIAAANGISESALQAANPNAVATNLQPGQTLKIPSSASSDTPFQAGVVAGQSALGTQYAQNYSAYQQAEAIRSNINNLVTQNPNLNPSQFTDINTALQFLNGKVSNPAYAILANNVAEYVNTLAPILGVGGDTTNYKTALAQQFLQGAASGQSMSQIMAGIAQTAALKLQQQQAAGTSTGSVSTPTNTTQNGTSNSTSIYNF